MRSSVRIVLLALALTACSSTPHRLGAAMLPGSTYGDYDSSGLATWYGEEAAGARTASGERFDPAGITAAHRSLPLGSYVEVTALDTGRTIVARVNDRGPGRQDRLIDLSRGAAQLLGTDRSAIARVRVRAINPGPRQDAALRSGYRFAAGAPMPSAFSRIAVGSADAYAVQVAAFSNAPRAAALAARIGGTVVSQDGLYRVRLGPFADIGTAQRARDAAATQGYGDAQVLAENH